MSTHRADKHRSKAADHPSDVAGVAEVSRPAHGQGRRRATDAPRRTTSFGSPSLVGGLALVVAAVGAATAGQAISAGDETTPTSSERRGAYVATMSSASLAGRDATTVSRSVVRPILAKKKQSAATTAERLAQLRADSLRDAASEAETYAEDLAKAERLARAAERRARAAELAASQWVLPTSGFSISTVFGEAGPYWSSGYHTGVDFATAYGTPAVAVTGAIVIQTGWDGPYGNQVRLQLENGDEVWYNHLSSIDVVSGQAVASGQQIGRIGDTGNSYGAHLHLEYRLASNLGAGVDPMPYLVENGVVF